MSVPPDQAFLNREPIAGVNFEHDDFVLVLSGMHAGNKGSLVSLLYLAPEPIFVLELESGFDIEIKQSQIAHATS
ncbi:hypothetical protein [Comamonas sp.]|uniref:hypothetical protein n=1 Tax=Comamonas sp. TaxID=34028 RepID=UPI0026473B58|nr:hypothetical protein [Comamonas sp.]MDN5536594.1 hypothetical protein [Comamonas sp.]